MLKLRRSFYVLCYKQQLFSMGSVIAAYRKMPLKKASSHIERKLLLMIFFMIVLGKSFLGKANKFPCHLRHMVFLFPYDRKIPANFRIG